jgi:hypothetical protein
MLSEISIKHFQELVKKHPGVELSREEALKQGTQLIEFTKILIRAVQNGGE